MVKILVKNLGGGKLPSYAHEGDAGMDFCSTEDVILESGKRHAFGTKIAMEIPSGHVGLVWDKSGLSRKQGLKVLGGVVDATYRGEVVITLINLGEESYQVHKGDKIAQMLIQKVESAQIFETDTFSETKRADKGFGSTGR